MADFLKLGKLIENLTGLVKVKIELLKLEIVEEISKGIAGLFSLLIVVILGLLVLIFGSLTVGAFLNEYYSSTYLGFLVISAFYIVLLILALIVVRSGKIAEKIEEELVRRAREKNQSVNFSFSPCFRKADFDSDGGLGPTESHLRSSSVQLIALSFCSKSLRLLRWIQRSR